MALKRTVRKLLGWGGGQVPSDGESELRQVLAAVATDLNAVKTLLNEVRADYEAHRQNTTAHASADTTNAVTTAALTYTYTIDS